MKVVEYNQGRVTAVNEVFDQPLGSCIANMLDDPKFPKLPSDPNPAQANARALAAVKSIQSLPVPPNAVSQGDKLQKSTVPEKGSLRLAVYSAPL